MANLLKLDDQRRLAPWLYQQHADFVASRYGSLLALSPEKAKSYLAAYRQKETEFDEAYKGQQEALKQSQTMLGQEPQKLPEPEKIDWNPEKRFGGKDNTPKDPKKAPVAKKPKTDKSKDPKKA